MLVLAILPMLILEAKCQSGAYFQISELASTYANECDLVFLPGDNGRWNWSEFNGQDYQGNSSRVLFSNDHLNVCPIKPVSNSPKALVFAGRVSSLLIEQTKCPLVVLPTSSPTRLGQAISALAMTRSQASLAVITQSQDDILKTCLKSKHKLTFNLFILSKHSELLSLVT